MSLQYRIAEIGWYNFERLAQTLLKAIIGSGVTSFGGSKDQGRDATYRGNAKFPSAEERWSGYWVFQVKYIDLQDAGAREARLQLKHALKHEISTIIARHRDGVDNYVFITDVPLTAKNRDEFATVARDCGHFGNFHIIDGHEVCEHLTLHPEIRRSYPQLLGLADLDHIINRKLYARSEAYLQQWQPRLAVFVQNSAYFKALRTLRQHSFIVLDGPPEVGKTMIAAAIALLYASDGYEVVDIRTPDDLFQAHKTKERQIYIADDAIGSINLKADLSDAWSRDLPGVLAKIDKQHVLIWTARHYILVEALNETRLGEDINTFPGAREILVEVGDLTIPERAEILYNHAKLASLPAAARGIIKARFRNIIQHPTFTPERIRQLCDDILRPEKTPTWELINRFMTNPTQRWRKAYNNLSRSEQLLLTAMLDSEDDAPLKTIQLAYEQRAQHERDRCLRFRQVLARLEHSFLQVSRTFTGMVTADFRHPSLRDVLLEELRDDPKARSRYIRLTTPVGIAALIRGQAATKQA